MLILILLKIDIDAILVNQYRYLCDQYRPFKYNWLIGCMQERISLSTRLVVRTGLKDQLCGTHSGCRTDFCLLEPVLSNR
jgi:ethanolamine ammonia-lyase large subunit